jgi:hypothetical protein
MKKGLLLLTLTTLISCTYSDKGDVVDKDDLIGKYVFQVDHHDTIDVNSNGTYSYYKWWHGRKLENSGTWNYDSSNGRVDFKNFSFLTDTMNIGDSTFVPRGSWNTRIKTEDNELRFIYATDIYKGYFLRVDTVYRTKVE